MYTFYIPAVVSGIEPVPFGVPAGMFSVKNIFANLFHKLLLDHPFKGTVAGDFFWSANKINGLC